MNRTYILPTFVSLLLLSGAAFAGNPDRQGEAGANQLLLNPWARSAGLQCMNTSSVSGTDAMFLNVAGLSRIENMQIQLGHTRYLEGADVNINALGFGKRVGKSGAFGFSLMAFDIGDIPLTTTNTPGGSGATYSPSFFNLGLSYSHLFANRVSVGLTVKFVNESVANAGASALALDAGVQYVTGPKDNFKFGISLRNVGGKMKFTGEGLSEQLPSSNQTFEYPLTYYKRSASYELPTQLNIGASYDWLLGVRAANRISLVGNFTSNSFSRDQVGLGLEFGLGKVFAVRGAYRIEFDAPRGSLEESLDNGISAGFTVSAPFRKGSNSRFSIEYAYRETNIFSGIHHLGLRLDL